MIANQQAARRQDRAQADAMSAERMRQARLDDESRGVNQRALERYDDAEGQQERRTSELAEVFGGDANRGAEVISAALPRSSSNITVQNDERERERASEFSGQQGEAMARMRSFADMFGGLGRDTARDASELGMLGGFKRGSQGVLPFELESAAQRGQGLRNAADAMNLFGSIGVNAGLSGGGLPRVSTNSVMGPMTQSPFPMPRPANLYTGG